MIELSNDQMQRIQETLQHIPGEIPKAMASALNRAAQSARTEASRKVRETYYVKHKDVTATIKIYKANPSDLSASVTSKGTLLALSKFRVTPKKPQPKRIAPIKARVKRGDGGPIQGAFVARMNSGHVGVFKRVGTPRLPIKELYGPSIPQMLDSDSVRQWVEQKAAEVLDQRLEHEISRRLNR